MKKLLLISLLTFIGLLAYAQADDSIMIPLSEADPPDYQELPQKGKRTPSKRETCVIDFTTLSIRTTVVTEIISYELWDCAGEYVVTVSCDDHDMVEFLSTASGCYQLHLVTEDLAFIGYITL